MMSRYFRGFVTLALAAFIFSGCSSIPAKATSEDSLVVIKTEFINPDNLPRGRELCFQFSGDYPVSWVGQYSWDYNLVVIREPGVMLQSIGTSVQAGFRGNAWEPEANRPLPYEPGRIVIADFVFVHKITKTAEHAQMTSLGFRKITAQEKEDLTQALRSDDRFASWME
jgi:hypothetical protein